MSRRVRTPEQKGARRIAKTGDTWTPIADGQDPGTPIADGLYCLAHSTWHPVTEFYPDRAKATGYAADCKEWQNRGRYICRVPKRRRSKYE